jgi:AP2-like factor, euAP2 lineage
MQRIVQMSKEELVQSLRRQSKGYHQNSSKYRGVTKHQKGKWEARIGQVIGKKYKYLGLFTSEMDAAIAYDRAAVQAKRLNAQTNFNISDYMDLLSAPQSFEIPGHSRIVMPR